MDETLTEVFEAIEGGDPRAAARLLPLVYAELRRLAAARLAGERAGQTLQATALVHEAYLRLLGPEGGDAARWANRAHFFAAAAEAMRRILVDRARAKATAKRGGSWRRIEAELGKVSVDDVPAELVELDEALDGLKAEDPAKAQLVELRFFGGLTMDQAAAVLGISPATAARHWAYARAWLYQALAAGEESSGDG